MRKSLIKKLCCPMDKSELHTEIFKEDENAEVLEGVMTCPQCNRYYPIIYGIPIMTPDEYREKSLEAPILERWGLEANYRKQDEFVLEGTKPKEIGE